MQGNWCLPVFGVIYCVAACCTVTADARLNECMNDVCEVFDRKSGQTIPAACEPLNLKKNIASMAKISVSPENATCGDPPVQFCGLNNRIICLQCDNTEGTGARHPPNFMVDGVPWRWWQSKPWPGLPGHTFEVNITFTFPKTFQLIGNIEIDFYDGLPQKMVVDKSYDWGKTWQPMQYYADDCRNEFNMEATDLSNPNTNVSVALQAFCTQEYSTNLLWIRQPTLTVHVNERIDVLRFNGFNGTSLCSAISGGDSVLRKFLLVTNIRLRLLRPPMVRTLIGEREFNQRSEHYGIKRVFVPGRCFCNGHAGKCEIGSKTAKCVCDHNTEGKDCEKCEVLYWMKPWMPGYFSPNARLGIVDKCTSFIEQAKKRTTNDEYRANTSSSIYVLPKLRPGCECHKHSERCEDVDMIGTLCVDCRHNTIGRRCDKCQNTYFRDRTKGLEHPSVCIPCNCEATGSRGRWCQPLGQCKCRQNFTGRRCDRCKAGWKLNGRSCKRRISECRLEKKKCADVNYLIATSNGRYTCIAEQKGWCTCVNRVNCTEPPAFARARNMAYNLGFSSQRTAKYHTIIMSSIFSIIAHRRQN